jgi:hypothetical protein
MKLYLADSILRVARVIKLSKNDYVPADGENFASIVFSKANLKALYQNKIGFVLDVKKNKGILPDYVKLVPHPTNKFWYIPKYSLNTDPTYSVEYVDNNQYAYKQGMTAEQILAGLELGFDIRRVAPENGAKLSKKFLDKLSMYKVKKGNFVYAVPNT